MRAALWFLAISACALPVPEAPPPRDPPSLALDPLFVPTLEGKFFDLGLEQPFERVPSWFEHASGDHESRDLLSGSAAIGSNHAVLPTVHGWFMTATRGPMVGPLPFPKHVHWVGMDGNDGVYVATTNGSLFHVAKPGLAHDRASYAATAHINGAFVWDAAGRFVVAAAAAQAKLAALPAGGASDVALVELWVSEDYGRHFEKRTLPGEAAIQVFVRADGFIHASVGDTYEENGGLRVSFDGAKAFVSKDAGHGWQPFEHPPHNMMRLGGAIYGSDSEGRGYVITRAGRAAQLDESPCLERWHQRVSLAAHPWPEPEACFTVDAAAPLSAAGLARRAAACGCPQPLERHGCVRQVRHWFRDGFMMADARSAPPSTRTRFGLFNTATCAERDRVKSTHELDASSCAKGARLLSNPVIAAEDAGTGQLSFASLPDGLAANVLLDAGGMGVLLTRAVRGRSRLFTVGADAVLHEEAAVPFDEGAVLRAADGTLVLIGSSSPTSGVGAFVRDPVELGQQDAWRDISTARAVSYLPLTGGRALVGAERVPGHEELSLSVAGPAGIRSLATVVRTRDPQESELAFDGQHLFLRSDRSAEWYAVAPDGDLVVTTSCFISGYCRDD